MDIEKTTGLLRYYLSRVKNGHIDPSLETLEKWAGGLSIPLYRIFYDGPGTPEPLTHSDQTGALWGSSGPEASELDRLGDCLERMDRNERNILLSFAVRLAKHSKVK